MTLHESNCLMNKFMRFIMWHSFQKQFKESHNYLSTMNQLPHPESDHWSPKFSIVYWLAEALYTKQILSYSALASKSTTPNHLSATGLGPTVFCFASKSTLQEITQGYNTDPNIFRSSFSKDAQPVDTPFCAFVKDILPFPCIRDLCLEEKVFSGSGWFRVIFHNA